MLADPVECCSPLHNSAAARGAVLLVDRGSVGESAFHLITPSVLSFVVIVLSRVMGQLSEGSGYQMLFRQGCGRMEGIVNK